MHNTEFAIGFGCGVYFTFVCMFFFAVLERNHRLQDIEKQLARWPIVYAVIAGLLFPLWFWSDSLTEWVLDESC